MLTRCLFHWLPGSWNQAPSAKDRMVPKALWLQRIHGSSGGWFRKRIELQISRNSSYGVRNTYCRQKKYQSWCTNVTRKGSFFGFPKLFMLAGVIVGNTSSCLWKLLISFQFSVEDSLVKVLQLEDVSPNTPFGQDEFSPRQVSFTQFWQHFYL